MGLLNKLYGILEEDRQKEVAIPILIIILYLVKL